MSSTGSISRVIAPTTTGAEHKRQDSISSISQPGITGGVRTTYGTITKVDADKALIKAHEVGTNMPIANGRWIPLNHSVREIAERWGKLQRGFVVQVQYTGPDGGDSSATIIRESHEHLTDELQEENTMGQGVYRIFAPGIGIG